MVRSEKSIDCKSLKQQILEKLGKDYAEWYLGHARSQEYLEKLNTICEALNFTYAPDMDSYDSDVLYTLIKESTALVQFLHLNTKEIEEMTLQLIKNVSGTVVDEDCKYRITEDWLRKQKERYIFTDEQINEVRKYRVAKEGMIEAWYVTYVITPYVIEITLLKHKFDEFFGCLQKYENLCMFLLGYNQLNEKFFLFHITHSIGDVRVANVIKSILNVKNYDGEHLFKNIYSLFKSGWFSDKFIQKFTYALWDILISRITFGAISRYTWFSKPKPCDDKEILNDVALYKQFGDRYENPYGHSLGLQCHIYGRHEDWPTWPKSFFGYSYEKEFGFKFYMIDYGMPLPNRFAIYPFFLNLKDVASSYEQALAYRTRRIFWNGCENYLFSGYYFNEFFFFTELDDVEALKSGQRLSADIFEFFMNKGDVEQYRNGKEKLIILTSGIEEHKRVVEKTIREREKWKDSWRWRGLGKDIADMMLANNPGKSVDVKDVKALDELYMRGYRGEKMLKDEIGVAKSRYEAEVKELEARKKAQSFVIKERRSKSLVCQQIRGL